MELTLKNLDTTDKTLVDSSKGDFSSLDTSRHDAIVSDVLTNVNASTENVVCSFGWRIHPNCEELKKTLDAWLQIHPIDNTIIGQDKLFKTLTTST